MTTIEYGITPMELPRLHKLNEKEGSAVRSMIFVRERNRPAGLYNGQKSCS